MEYEYPGMKCLRKRLYSLKNQDLTFAKTTEFASSGFFFCQELKLIICYCCGFEGDLTQVPLNQHKPDCRQFKDLVSNQILEQAFQIFPEPLVNQVAVAKYKEFKSHYLSLKELSHDIINYTKKNAIKEHHLESKVKFPCENVSIACKICFADVASTIIKPCYHQVCCPMCLNNIDKCPICRVSIESVINSIIV